LVGSGRKRLKPCPSAWSMRRVTPRDKDRTCARRASGHRPQGGPASLRRARARPSRRAGIALPYSDNRFSSAIVALCAIVRYRAGIAATGTEREMETRRSKGIFPNSAFRLSSALTRQTCRSYQPEASARFAVMPCDVWGNPRSRFGLVWVSRTRQGDLNCQPARAAAWDDADLSQFVMNVRYCYATRYESRSPRRPKRRNPISAWSRLPGLVPRRSCAGTLGRLPPRWVRDTLERCSTSRPASEVGADIGELLSQDLC
jgi:hypothetical protein